MEKTIKDIMIPIEVYPKVTLGDTLQAAIITLRQAHSKLADMLYRPRAILITNADGDIVGKLNMWDAIRALEPRYGKMGDFSRLTHFGLNPEFIRKMVAKHDLWTDPLDTLCQKGAAMKVEDIMHEPHEDEYIPEDSQLGEAVHQLVMGNHLSLLVTRDDKVVGFLRLCDVFDDVAAMVEVCTI